MKKRVIVFIILCVLTVSTFSLFFNSFYTTNIVDSNKNEKNSELLIDKKNDAKKSDGFEPNNYFANAVKISEGYYTNLNISTPTDEDWFYLTVNERYFIIVNISFLHSNGNIDLALFDSFNTELIGSYTNSDNESIVFYVNNPGDYYIRIYGESNPNYDLEIITDDEFEPNNDYFSAAYITMGYYPSLKCVNDDWYGFWVDKYEEFTVELSFSTALGDLNMELFNDSQDFISGSYSVTDNEIIQLMATYTGYHYIKIYCASTFDNNYLLDIYIEMWNEDKYEYNNDFWSASEIYKGNHRHLYCQDDDWYKLFVSPGEQIAVDIFFQHNFGNLDMELYDQFNNYIMRSDSWDNDEKFSFTSTYLGYYYIYVYKKSTEDNFYEMKIGGQSVNIFYEDFEGSLAPEWSGFGGTNYWQVTTRDSSPESPICSLWCGNDSTGMYNKEVDGKPISYTDSITIKDIDLRDLCYAELNFDCKLTTGSSLYDEIFVSVNVLGDDFYLSSKFTKNDFKIGATTNNFGWQNISMDLSFFCGYEHVDIIFSFEADEFDNSYEGVMIDDVLIKGLIDDELVGYNLFINKGDVYYYDLSYINSNAWSNIFGKSFQLAPSSETKIKIQIMDITDLGTYWTVNALFWEPWDDFDKLTSADEINFKIYKNPLNMKDGIDFFIAAGDMWKYTQKVDNFDYLDNYNIETWENWGEYQMEFSYGEFVVKLIYMHNGILKRMRIYDNLATYNKIFDMWIGEPPVDDDEENLEDEDDPTIPGYDIVIICSLICVISIVSAIKIKKINKSKK